MFTTIAVLCLSIIPVGLGVLMFGVADHNIGRAGAVIILLSGLGAATLSIISLAIGSGNG